MIEHKGTFYAGAFIFLIPFLGFPTMWKMVLVGIAGFILMIVSLKVPTPRKIIKDKIKNEAILTPNVSPEIKNEVVVPDVVEAPIVQAQAPTPKIEIIVPKKRRVSTRVASTRKLNVEE